MNDLNDLMEYRQLDTSENVEIPLPAKSRTITDKKGLILYGVAVLILLPFLIYGLVNAVSPQSDYLPDDCGFFCQIEHGASLNKVTNKVGFLEVSREWWKIIVPVLITIGLGLSVLLLFRYAPACLVWGSICLFILSLTVGVVIVWWTYAVTESLFFLKVAILWTIGVIIILIVFAVIVKKIPLVIQLFKEAVKVLAAMPLLTIVPIFTTCAQFVVLSICYVTSFRLLLVPAVSTDKYSAVVLFTIIIHFIVTIWTMFLAEGVQYMIISGSVSKWYFSENRESLDSPILTSAKITFKFHLGTVAFGSFLMILFSWVKAILKVIFRTICCRCLIVIYCPCVEIVLRFLSKNSYIETALHGQSYIKSAKRTINLLSKNAESVIAVNCVGGFVLAVMRILLIALTTVISWRFFLNNDFFDLANPFFVCLYVNMSIVGVTFATLQTIIDTLLICFCEDSVLNDGVTKPFFMTKGLMEFIEASKQMS